MLGYGWTVIIICLRLGNLPGSRYLRRLCCGPNGPQLWRRHRFAWNRMVLGRCPSEWSSCRLLLRFHQEEVIFLTAIACSYSIILRNLILWRCLVVQGRDSGMGWLWLIRIRNRFGCRVYRFGVCDFQLSHRGSMHRWLYSYLLQWVEIMDSILFERWVVYVVDSISYNSRCNV